MIKRPIVLLLIMALTAFSLVACGISADVHDAVVAEKEAAQASVAQLQKEKEAAQALVAQLEKDKEAAQTSVAQLQKEKEAAQTSVAQLEKENRTLVVELGSIKADLTQAEVKVQALGAVYPPKRFSDRADIEAWLRNDDISERESASTAEGLYSKALEQQARALEDGYIVSAEYSGPDENYEFSIWMSAVAENSNYFMWNPEQDEVVFVANPSSPTPTLMPAVTPTPTATSPMPTPTPFTVQITDSVSTIVHIYQSNEAAAESQYTGKIADITGHVWSVNKRGQYWEVEFISGLGPNLICKMSGEDMDVAASLKQGERVTVRGKILGVPGFINVVVEPCEVISK